MRRPTTKQRGYGGRWPAISRAAIARHPWCALCGRTDDLTTDHLEERTDPTAPRSTAPHMLRVLCRSCNTRRQNAANELRGIGWRGGRSEHKRPGTNGPRGALAE